MVETPTVLTVGRQEAAVIGTVVPRADMPNFMGPAVAELIQVLRDQGVAAAGPLFAHHLRTPTDTFAFELGLPVARPVAAAGRVAAGFLPAATVARTTHHGPYEGLPAAWGAFRRWIDEAGHACAADLWEVYVSGPGQDPDPATWRTDLVQPLAV